MKRSWMTLGLGAALVWSLPAFAQNEPSNQQPSTDQQGADQQQPSTDQQKKGSTEETIRREEVIRKNAKNSDTAANADAEPTGATTLKLGKSDIKEAQQVLKGEGFFKGTLTGKVDTRTKSALRKFQRSRDLPVTGRIDAKTAQELGIRAAPVRGREGNDQPGEMPDEHRLNQGDKDPGRMEPPSTPVEPTPPMPGRGTGNPTDQPSSEPGTQPPIK